MLSQRQPKIFAEELLLEKFENGDFQYPNDYKIHCFNGLTQEIFIQVDTERFSNHKRTIFNANWEQMPFSLCYISPKTIPQKPQNLPQMLQIAKRLSQPFNAIRVDLYNANDTIFIGELTFTHGGGTERFTPDIWDSKFAKSWQVNAIIAD